MSRSEGTKFAFQRTVSGLNFLLLTLWVCVCVWGSGRDCIQSLKGHRFAPCTYRTNILVPESQMSDCHSKQWEENTREASSYINPWYCYYQWKALGLFQRGRPMDCVVFVQLHPNCYLFVWRWGFQTKGISVHTRVLAPDQFLSPLILENANHVTIYVHGALLE